MCGLHNIRYRMLPKMWEVRSLQGAYSTAQWKDFELIMVKRETRHLVEGYFGSEFWAICNHCELMAA